MQRSRTDAVDVLIVLMSLVAEGTPQLALQLARQWKRDGLRVEVMVLQPQPIDMQAEFEALGLTLHHVNPRRSRPPCPARLQSGCLTR